MREVNIRKLRANLAKELEDLPLAVTKNKKVVAIIASASELEASGPEVSAS